RPVLPRDRHEIARANFCRHRQAGEDHGVGEEISAIPRSVPGLHRDRAGPLVRATFVVANGLEEIAVMNFGAPNWFWALLAIPIAILHFARPVRRGAWRLRGFVC